MVEIDYRSRWLSFGEHLDVQLRCLVSKFKSPKLAGLSL